MKAIPVEVKDVITILNLPNDMGANPIFDEHHPLVMDYLERYTLEAAFRQAKDDELDPVDKRWAAFRYAYAFLMLYSTAEFLNLKTVGEGIVKTVGLDQSATELLTGEEIEAFKSKLELRALDLLRDYLSPAGIERYLELKPRIPKVLRAGVI